MRIVIVIAQEFFARGGAEILAEDLRDAVIGAGHEAEIVAIPFEGYPTEHLMNNMLAFRLLDLAESQGKTIDRLIALKFPAYLIPHPKKVIWLVHQMHGAYGLWEGDSGLSRQPEGIHGREMVHRADRRAFGEADGVFSISKNVSARLLQTTGHDSEVLYPPPRNAAKFFNADDQGYLFFPGRMVPLKRQHLAVEALAHTRDPVRLVFVGPREDEKYATSLEEQAERLGVASRIEWRGVVTESDLLSTYAHCRGVVYPSFDEDYGYVTLEAMLASKPVITCRDSGGTLEFVKDHETGLVADPISQSLAEAMDELWADPEQARRWGDAGRKSYDAAGISWTKVIKRLLS